MNILSRLHRAAQPRSARAFVAITLSFLLSVPPAHADASAKDAKPADGWGQNGRPVVPSNPRPDQVFEGIVGPGGGTVYFRRTKDAAGMPEVKTINPRTQETLHGTLLANGTIKWESKGVAPELLSVPEIAKAVAQKKAIEEAKPEWVKSSEKAIKRVVRARDRGYISVKASPKKAQDAKVVADGPAKSPYARNQLIEDLPAPKSGLKVFGRGSVNADGRPELRAFDTKTNELWYGVELKNKRVKWQSQGFRGKTVDPNVVKSADVTQRPSDLKRLMNWGEAQSKAAGEKFKEIGSKTSTFFERYNPAEDGKITTADTVRGMNKAQTATLAFVAALGGATAINMALHPELNPIAIDQAYGTLTDEISWLSMGGYIMTSNFIINSRGFNAATPGLQAPLYGIALALGTLTSMAIMEFANDPDVKACISTENYHMTGNPFDSSREFPARPRDYDACDRAFSKPHLRDIAQRIFVEKFMPTAAAMIVSGSAFYGAMYGGGKLIKAMKLFGNVTTTMGSATPMGAALRIGLNIALSTAFMAVYEKPMNWTMQRWAKWRLASLTASPGTYGENIEHAENDLLDSWERIKKNDWVDPSNLAHVKNVCYDEKRVGSKYYDCANTSSPDFEGSLLTYHGLQAKWREMMLEPTRQVYQQWVEKVQDYQQLYAFTKSFYEKAIEKIVFTIRNPNVPASDPRVFSLESMGVNAHSRWIPDGWRSLLYKMMFIYSFDGDFEYVETPSLPEKLMASLACGTEAEGAPEPGFIDSTSRFVHQFIIGDAAPSEMLKNKKGRKVVFSPPRITTPMPGNNSVCGWNGVTSRIKKATVGNLPVTLGDKSYVGLPAYIIDNVRNTIVTADGYSRMDVWWQDYVASRDTELNAQLANEYQKVVDRMFKPALLNTSYYVCEVRPGSVGTALQDYLYRLGVPAETCGPAQMHRLANGVVGNLRDQARLYIAMMMDLAVSSRATDKASATTLLNQVLTPARALLETYDRFIAEYTTLSDPKRMNESLTALASAFKTFQAAVTAPAVPTTARVLSVEFDTEPKQAKVDDESGVHAEWMKTLTADLNETLATLTAYVQLASLPKATGK